MLTPNVPYLMEPTRLQAMYRKMANLPKPTPCQLEGAREAAKARLMGNGPSGQKRGTGGIAVIPVYGPLSQHMDDFAFYGGTSMDMIGEAITYYASRGDVGCTVLDVDSPGGESYGCQELSDLIHDARKQIAIVAVCNSMCCSAAFWVASAASQLVCTPGGDVGSVGVYCLHVSYEGALEKEGVEVTLVSSGEFKVDGNAYEALTDSARASMQEVCDHIYAKFVKGVARNRGVPTSKVLSSYGQGKVLNADKALAVGMVDRIEPMSALLSKLTIGSGGSYGRGPRASAQVLLARGDQHERTGYLCELEAETERLQRCQDNRPLANGKSMVQLRAEQQKRKAADPAPPKLPTIIGYVSVYGQRYTHAGSPEEVTPGAFKKALGAGKNIKALLDHDWNKVVGQTAVCMNNLELRSDEHGLLAVLRPQFSADGLALVQAIRDGRCASMSWEGKIIARDLDAKVAMKAADVASVLTEVDLQEVTFATGQQQGANPATAVWLCEPGFTPVSPAGPRSVSLSRLAKLAAELLAPRAKTKGRVQTDGRYRRAGPAYSNAAQRRRNALKAKKRRTGAAKSK